MMKKRNLKTLQLKKDCISKLYGGSIYQNAGDTVHYDTGIDTTTFIPPNTQGVEPGCWWYSELYTACECNSAKYSNCIECPLEQDTKGSIGHHHG